MSLSILGVQQVPYHGVPVSNATIVDCHPVHITSLEVILVKFHPFMRLS